MGLNKGAIALHWDAEKDEAPRLIAAGKGPLADKILALAELAGIPIVEKEPLVEALIDLQPGAVIPYELFRLTAEVYIFLTKLDELY
ncbi:MAG: EscU/YscU/HrcU family type III secretion system export apparatus switch protein [Spirochaetaceae bacterium]|jgi:flagellar biosynthesis protein|nr:EscU/YscU/HrcU family type III secretion system export apparatus switch protein [Spirochaetaceae bacterium]